MQQRRRAVRGGKEGERCIIVWSTVTIADQLASQPPASRVTDCWDKAGFARACGVGNVARRHGADAGKKKN